ncbi:MAG: OprO/OprP family phosphate-selective porin [Verrucomicrobiales bacterium]
MKRLSPLFFAGAVALSSVQGVAQATPESARIQDLEKRLEELDQKYRILERKIEIDQEAASEKSKTAPSMSIGQNGFSYRSADTNFVLRIRGLIQADGRFYIDDNGNNVNDTFLLRRARPIIEGTLWKNLDFTLVPEFGGGSTTTGGTSSASTPSILDAFINARYSPELQLRVGKFKSPVGLEQLQSDTQAPFIERALPSALTPNRDLGVMLHGEVLDGVVNYAAGVFNGVGDNRTTANIDNDDEKEVAARLFFHPFQKTDVELIQGFGFGLGGSYGNQEGGSSLPAGNGYVTEAGQQFFSYRQGAGTNAATANVTADGTHWRLSPQAYWYYRNFSLLGEYVISSQELRRNDPVATFGEVDNTAWQIVGGYVITGEDASYKGVTPRNPLSISEGHWGAWEVVARYSQLDIDNDAFPTFATAATSASRADAFGVGLNWYANRNIRAAVNYIHTEFSGGGSGRVTGKDENAIMTRLQLAF